MDDYFDSGPRYTEWLGGRVMKVHRTVEDYFSGLQHAGFSVENLREARPQRGNFVDQDTFRRRLRMPLFLIMAVRKPAR